MSPTQRSLKLLRDEGWLAVVVERWNPYAKIRQDLLGFGDILAVKGNVCTMIQTTSGDHVAARISKILAEPNAMAWLSVPSHIIEVHGWRKVGPRGKRKTWQVRRQYLTVGGGTNLPASPVSGTARANL